MRAATAADAPAIAALVGDGIRAYAAFAPPEWDAETEGARVGGHAAELGAPDSPLRAWVCEDDDGLSGFVGYVPAAQALHAALPDPALAHLRFLFVAPRAWGGPVARELHATALDDARTRGFTAMRLYCAEGQARARRFYEREGWVRESRLAETPLGLPVIVYRRAL